MADFCKQCSQELFGEDNLDFVGLLTEQEITNGQFALVLCEGCGPTAVDENGQCMAAFCLENHGQHEYTPALSPL